MIKKLHSLDVAEVSLVSQGANKRRFYMLKFKKAPDERTTVKKADPSALDVATTVATDLPADAIPETSVRSLDDFVAAEGLTNPDDIFRTKSVMQGVIRMLDPLKSLVSGRFVHDVLEANGFPYDGPTSEDTQASTDDGSIPVTASAPIKQGREKAMSSSFKEWLKSKVQKNESGESSEPLATSTAPQDGVTKALDEIPNDILQEAAAEAAKRFREFLSEKGFENVPDFEVGLAQASAKSDASEVATAEVAEAVSKSMNGDQDMEKAKEYEMLFKSQQNKIEQLEKALKDREENERKSEVIRKSASYTHLPFSQEDIQATLSDAQKTSQAAFERVCKQYDTMNEQAKKAGMFSELGTTQGAQVVSSNDAWSQILQGAQNLVQKSATKMTEDQAIVAFLKTAEGHALNQRYEQERRRR